MKKFDVKNVLFFFDKITLNLVIFSSSDFACAYIVHIQGNQLVPELLLKLSDPLRKQSRCIEHVHNCLSNLAILCGLCILEISFL